MAEVYGVAMQVPVNRQDSVTSPPIWTRISTSATNVT